MMRWLIVRSGPGIKATYYRVDGGAQTTGTVIAVGPPASGVATHTIQFWSVDTGGLKETTESATFTINTAPTWATYTYTGADQTFTVPAGVTWEAARGEWRLRSALPPLKDWPAGVAAQVEWNQEALTWHPRAHWPAPSRPGRASCGKGWVIMPGCATRRRRRG